MDEQENKYTWLNEVLPRTSCTSEGLKLTVVVTHIFLLAFSYIGSKIPAQRIALQLIQLSLFSRLMLSLHIGSACDLSTGT